MLSLSQTLGNIGLINSIKSCTKQSRCNKYKFCHECSVEKRKVVYSQLTKGFESFKWCDVYYVVASFDQVAVKTLGESLNDLKRSWKKMRGNSFFKEAGVIGDFYRIEVSKSDTEKRYKPHINVLVLVPKENHIDSHTVALKGIWRSLNDEYETGFYCKRVMGKNGVERVVNYINKPQRILYDKDLAQGYVDAVNGSVRLTAFSGELKKVVSQNNADFSNLRFKRMYPNLTDPDFHLYYSK